MASATSSGFEGVALRFLDSMLLYSILENILAYRKCVSTIPDRAPAYWMTIKQIVPLPQS
jgi:hypothetical protein